MYALAGGLVVGIVPFTLVFMLGTNRKLQARAAQWRETDVRGRDIDGKEEEEVRELVEKWRKLNLARAVIATTGCVISVLATLRTL